MASSNNSAATNGSSTGTIPKANMADLLPDVGAAQRNELTGNIQEINSRSDGADGFRETPRQSLDNFQPMLSPNQNHSYPGGFSSAQNQSYNYQDVKYAQR